jgi:excisionase family DNA binding protein
MMSETTSSRRPSASDVRVARETSKTLAALLQDAGADASVHLHIGAGGDQESDVMLPSATLPLLLEALQGLARGHAVTVVSAAAELTTQQAADLLRVSRPFLIKLLDAGRLPYRKVGAHRRLLAGDVLEYAQQERVRREQVMDELDAETRRLGLVEPPGGLQR